MPAANAGRRVLTLFEADAAHLIGSGNWQLGAMGEVRSCTVALPCLSLPGTATPGDIRLCPRPTACPRGCATTTRRPRSRRRPRIGAGWDPVTKSINNQTASCACLRRETSSLRGMSTRVTRLLSAARLRSPIRRARDGTTTLGLEGIEDDNGLCYCSPASGTFALPNPDVLQFCCSLLDSGICVDRLGLLVRPSLLPFEPPVFN
jgi:hypothetical protein